MTGRSSGDLDEGRATRMCVGAFSREATGSPGALKRGVCGGPQASLTLCPYDLSLLR